MKYILPAIASIIVAIITTWGTLHVAGRDITEAKQKAQTAKDDAETATRQTGSLADLTRLPVGSIIASMLPPQKFSELAGDSGNFDPGKSVWVPADGRSVNGSAYTKQLAQGHVPDLRSIFLRGLNTFDESEPSRPKVQQDPDERRPGEYQPDAFAKHSHRYGTTTESGSGKPGTYGAQPGNLQFRTEETGDAPETRPKNSAVFYYIKIN